MFEMISAYIKEGLIVALLAIFAIFGVRIELLKHELLTCHADREKISILLDQQNEAIQQEVDAGNKLQADMDSVKKQYADHLKHDAKVKLTAEPQDCEKAAQWAQGQF